MSINNPLRKIWTLPGFISQQECQDLILLSEMRGFDEATVSMKSGPVMIKGLRNNYRLEYSDTRLAARLWDGLKAHLPAVLDGWEALGLNERFRFYRYEDNQRFKRHIDGRFRRSDMEESRITFMIYLNDDFKGGETAFDEVVVKPETGTALCFIHEQKHEGRPVTEGIKYVLRTDVMYKKKL